MYLFRAYNLLISSAIPLPGVAAVADGQPDIVVRCGSSLSVLPDMPDGAGRRGDADEIDLYWEDAGLYRIRAGREVIIEALPGVDLATLGLYLLGPVLGLLLDQRGLLVLHANAIALHGQALLVAGESGAGKSTIAAALCQRGHGLLADDVAAVAIDRRQVATVLAGLLRVKLEPMVIDHLGLEAADSAPVHPEDSRRLLWYAGPDGDSLPLGAVLVLCDGANVEFERLAPSAALLELLAHSYPGRYLGRAAITKSLFQKLACLSERYPVYRLWRPHVLGSLPALADHLERLAAEIAPINAGQ